MSNYVVASELIAYDRTSDPDKSWLLVNNKVPNIEVRRCCHYQEELKQEKQNISMTYENA